MLSSTKEGRRAFGVLVFAAGIALYVAGHYSTVGMAIDIGMFAGLLIAHGLISLK